MRCTLPPGAGTLSEAGGPRGPKQPGGRRPPRRRAGGGVVGGEKYSSLELDATAAAGVAGGSVCGGGEAELSDDSGDVTAALQEPYPGWIDNVYGVTGIIMEISRGTYRSGYCRERYVVDLVPVDMVVNSCILAAWRQGVKQPGRCPVYNVTSGSINPLQWGQFTKLCVKWALENPTKYVMWYPNFAFTESRFMNTFWEITCHFLPAFMYDLLLRAQGRKAIMMKLARRFKMAAATGEYFANHEWQFGIAELSALHEDATVARDSGLFPHWPADFDWDSYIGAYMFGIRRYILKDSAESLPVARTKLRRLYWVHKLFQAATGYYVFRFLAGRLR